MIDIAEIYFHWPVLPFTFVALLISFYWLMVILAGIDLDVIDIDLDFDADLDASGGGGHSIADLGMLGLRWLNIGEVPFMVWLSIVVLVGWVCTMILDGDLQDPTLQQNLVAIGRSLGIGLLVAKFLTDPLRGMFRFKQPNTVNDLIGQHCLVVTSEVNEEFGNALCDANEGSPLRLNVRTTGGSFPRETIVEIVGYSEEFGVYYVEAANV